MFKDVKLQEFTQGNYGAVPYLSVNASKSADGSKVYLMVINKNMTADITTKIKINPINFNAQTAQAWTLNDYSEDGISTVDETNEVDPDNVSVRYYGAITLNSVTFPKHSLTVIKIMDIVCTDNDGDQYYQEGGACGVIDCDDNDDDITSYTYYQDSDGDGHGDPGQSIQSCSPTPPAGYVTDNKDCDDSDPKEYPDQTWYKDTDGDSYSSGEINTTSCTRPAGYKAASELTDISGDCNDDDSSINPATLWHPDFDGDGYGNPTVSLQQCTQPTGYILNDTDCDDSDAYIYPGGPPVRVEGSTINYYSALQDAYNASGDGETIQSLEVTLTESPNLNLDKSVLIQGGYDCSYTTQTGKTTVNGNMSISDGTITLKDFVIE